MKDQPRRAGRRWGISQGRITTPRRDACPAETAGLSRQGEGESEEPPDRRWRRGSSRKVFPTARAKNGVVDRGSIICEADKAGRVEQVASLEKLIRMEMGERVDENQYHQAEGRRAARM